MKIAVFGTGTVGQTIGAKLIEVGHDVMMGSRTSDNPKAVEFTQKHGGHASNGNYADAAAFGEIIFNCTRGDGSLDAMKAAGQANLKGKIIVDVSNPLDSSNGMPPTLSISNTNSLGEEIQRACPDAFVVKTLNTMWCGLMVNPRLLKETHQVFMCGNHQPAKDKVNEILRSFGWLQEEILDLGDISSARGTEGYLPVWLRIWMATGSAAFNIKIVR